MTNKIEDLNDFLKKVEVFHEANSQTYEFKELVHDPYSPKRLLLVVYDPKIKREICFPFEEFERFKIKR